MGCYGIGVSRMAAACIEQNHDDRGIIWPPQIAPYHVHLIGLNLEDPVVREGAESIYQRLQQERIEVLFDDRPLRAGEKFSDADLIGLPARITVSKRTLEKGQVEFKRRAEGQAVQVGLDEAIERIRQMCAASTDS